MDRIGYQTSRKQCFSYMHFVIDGSTMIYNNHDYCQKDSNHKETWLKYFLLFSYVIQDMVPCFENESFE